MLALLTAEMAGPLQIWRPKMQQACLRKKHTPLLSTVSVRKQTHANRLPSKYNLSGKPLASLSLCVAARRHVVCAAHDVQALSAPVSRMDPLQHCMLSELGADRVLLTHRLGQRGCRLSGLCSSWRWGRGG